MKAIHTLSAGAASALLILAIPMSATASDWPHLRGPGQDGRASAGEELAASPGLEPAWRVELGPGYSGIAVGQGRAVTAFSRGNEDVVAAFDAATGREVWRHVLNPITKGHDGSDDGPLSTPTLLDGRVFMLGAKGRLVALALEDGSLLWSKSLPEVFGTVEPGYGFSTTPTAIDGKLVVLTGGPEEHAMSALDPATGDVLWSVGSESVSDQMPIAMSLAGQSQIVAVSGRLLEGRSPEDGALLWSHDLGEDAWTGSSTPTYAGENRVLLFASGEAVVIEVAASEAGDFEDAGFAAQELYRTKTLGNTYALPVYRDGHLYGFRGQILSCVDAESGELVWRSRPPGGRGLILLDNKLVIFGAEGNVVIADASPTGYRERARVEALGSSAYTWPAYAGGRILVRNLEEMAAVRVTQGTPSAEMQAVAEAAGDSGSGSEDGEFASWITRVEALESAEARGAAIDAYLAEHPRSPILDAGRAHFVYRGEAEDLVLQGTMFETVAPVSMEQLAGTDFFYRSVPVEPAMRYEYLFTKDYEERLADPRNPDAVPSRWGPDQSQFVTEGYELADHLASVSEAEVEAEAESEAEAEAESEVGARRGRLEEVKVETAVGERDLRVYLPAGYDESDERYPLLVVYDGLEWIEKGLMVNTLDNLVGKSVQPIVVAFLGRGSRWWLEAGGSETAEHVAALTGEVVPFLSEKYRLSREVGSHAVMGNLGYGVAGIYAALAHPEVFGKVAIQSPQVTLGAEDAVRELLSSEAAGSIQVYLDWNKNEARDTDVGFDLYEQSTGFAETLAAHNIDYVGGEARDSFGWASWRSRTDRILETFFPLSE